MIYTGDALREISFPLGGIGTGCVGLAGNGRLIDWEMFNKPAKGSSNGYTHLAVRAVTQKGGVCKVLQGDLTKDLTGQYKNIPYQSHTGFGYGPSSGTMCGFPHFRNLTFNGEFPIAVLKFADTEFPGSVTLTAFNPLIPLNSLDSSLPAAFFEVAFTNDSDESVEYQTAFALQNPFAKSENEAIRQSDLAGVFLKHADTDLCSTAYGELCIACADADTLQAYWYRGGWQDSIVTYWNEFSSGEGMRERNYDTPGSNDGCTVWKSLKAAPGETVKMRFVMTWNMPNRCNDWSGKEELLTKTWKNYYATVFADAKESAAYCLKNWDRLYAETLLYKEELFAVTADPAVIDAVSATTSVLKSPTIFRLENGEFYGFEGVTENTGSCEGTCQHVYNYAYALCFLFPDLERSIRDLEFEHCVWETGETAFRLPLPLADPVKPWRACVDGQMGCVIKTYREWKISGDNEWLKKVWPKVKQVLEFAWSDQNPDEWDKDKDGVLEGRQHHTLDMELFGPSSWLQGFYLAALKAAAEMAEFLGESDKAAEYMEIFEKGKAWTKENLFNGKWFVQKTDINNKALMEHFDCVDRYWNEETGEIKYQIAEGSSIDQLCGQWHANLCGLGRLFDEEQIKTACRNLFKNNFKPTMRAFTNPWRIFSLNDDAGAVICDYPEGAYKPRIPITYCEETMTGFEYQMAGLLMSEGFIEEGLQVVKGIRNRYQGYNRNPWNEIECGSNYVRSMASYGLLPILSGFSFDLPGGSIGFDPRLTVRPFRSVWSLGTGWGNVVIGEEETTVRLLSGSLMLSRLCLPYIKEPQKLIIDGKEISFVKENGTLLFEAQTVTEFIRVF